MAIHLLSTLLDQAAGVIGGLSADQVALPTPCSAWDVSTAVNHLIDDLGNFTVAAEGGQPDWGAEPSKVPFDMWSDVFASETSDLMAAWQGAPEDARSGIDMQLGEIVAHAWDIAKASGQSVALNPEAASRGLEWSRAQLTADRRGTAFGPEVKAPDGSAPVDQLVAWFGRNPDWAPPVR